MAKPASMTFICRPVNHDPRADRVGHATWQTPAETWALSTVITTFLPSSPSRASLARRLTTANRSWHVDPELASTFRPPSPTRATNTKPNSTHARTPTPTPTHTQQKQSFPDSTVSAQSCSQDDPAYRVRGRVRARFTPAMASSNERPDKHLSPEPYRSSTVEGGASPRSTTKGSFAPP